MKSFLATILLLTVNLFAEKPNIVLIMVDDMGYSDIGAWGGEIDTPNLDSLAENGLRFTQFYNSARCCPTRASLLTGLHPHQVGIGHMTREDAHGSNQGSTLAYAGNLNDSCVTLAQVAKSAGYATFMTGKWHLAGYGQEDWPLQRGFDRFYGTIAGAANFFHPSGWRSIYDGNEKVENPESTSDRPYYTTDAFTDYAIDYLSENEETYKKPFFLYLAYNAPHWPLHAHDEEINKYRGKYDKGWDTFREERFKRQVESGLIPSEWKMSPRDPKVPAWDTVSEKDQKESAFRMASYAAMMDRVDQKLGDLIAELKRTGQFENTLIMFLSDNGACAEGPLFGAGDPIADRAPDRGSFEPVLGQAWANVGSTPYRLYKHYAHEGGANTPFIAHWPAGIEKGQDWYRTPAQLVDVMATVVELTGAKYPEEVADSEILPMVGVSLTSAFNGKALERKGPIMIEHEDNAFIRDGKWKLVGRGVSPASGLKKEKWELYDMSKDGTELNNLADSEDGRERVKEMTATWEKWAEETGVYPKRN